MNYRIGNGKRLFLLTLAVAIDIIEIVLTPTIVVAIVSGIIQYGVMWILFAFSGVKFFGTVKRVKRQLVGGILESIPVVEMLPIYTWNVWTTIEESRREDEQKQQANNQSQDSSTIREKNDSGANKSSGSVGEKKNSNVIRSKRS